MVLDLSPNAAMPPGDTSKDAGARSAESSPMPRITLDTPLKFTAPGGVAYTGRGRWHLPQGDQPGDWMRDYKTKPIPRHRGYHWCEAQHAIHHLHAECYLIEPRGVTVRGDDKCVSQGGRAWLIGVACGVVLGAAVMRVWG